MHHRLRPKVVLSWGIVLTAVGALLVLFLPDIAFALSHTGNPSKGVQAIMVGVSTVVQLINVVVVPLGAVLIGAALVMLFLERNLSADPANAAADSWDPADESSADDFGRSR